MTATANHTPAVEAIGLTKIYGSVASLVGIGKAMRVEPNKVLS